jgi:hypothetical protein
MPVKKVDIEVDVLALFPRKEKKTFYVTTDKTEFTKKSEATAYEKRWLAIREFQNDFSENKNNFRLGDSIFNEVAFPINLESYDVLDCFWIKFMTDEDVEKLY